MQSGLRCHRPLSELAAPQQQPQRGSSNASSSRRGHHASRVDGKLPMELLGHKPGLFEWRELHNSISLLSQMLSRDQERNGWVQSVGEALAVSPQVLRCAARQVQNDVERCLTAYGLSAEAALVAAKNAHVRRSCSCSPTPEFSRVVAAIGTGGKLYLPPGPSADATSAATPR